jgi:uncharacterized membrane protein YfcA
VPIADPWFYLIAVPALLVTGISKGGFGGGLGIVAVPLLALVVSPAEAAAILLPLLILMDLIGVRAYWRRFDGHALAVMLPGAVLGIALGGLAFGVLDASATRLIVGLIALAFVAHYFLGGGRLAPARPPNAWLGASCGALAGFTSTIAHAGSPPAALYLLPLKLDKTRFVATNVVLFAAINLLKLVPYAAVGEFTARNLATALVLAPLAPLSMILGMRLHHRIEPTTFYRLCYAFVAITGLKLVYDALI